MVKERVEKLRSLITENNMHAYLIPGTDPHQSEYIPAPWRRREWISGFTGSAGDVVISLEKGGLWTDSRYFIQAETELRGSGIALFRKNTPGVPEISEWLKEELKSGMSLGVDSRLLTVTAGEDLEKTLGRRGIRVGWQQENLVDRIWENRPSFSESAAEPHPVAFSGEPVSAKLKRLRREMSREGSEVHVLTTLDSIAWLFNIRGRDVAYNPIVIAYAIVTEDNAELFLSLHKIGEELENHLSGLVRLREYQEFGGELERLARDGRRINIDPRTASRWVAGLIECSAAVFHLECPVVKFKAVKNDAEITGWKKAHVRDGAAMVRFLKWLQENRKKREITEISATEKLEALRSGQEHFIGPSFETIAAFGEHGAIVHYAPSRETDTPLGKNGLFLIDSGAQYLDGTTDITRTISFGTPTEEQKHRFTLVLKGYIKLASALFPIGTRGIQLDVLARRYLWDEMLDYGHGTGHGIGSYLNVHENPPSVSPHSRDTSALEPGMFLSIEPGYYKEGEYGIRTENLAVVRNSPANNGFLCFEIVTLCPIDLNLVDRNILEEEETAFLNGYHHDVRRELSPLIDPAEREWLKINTRSL